MRPWGTLNDDTIPRLRCSIIAGAANNQLEDELRHGTILLDRSITFAPDFLINAGGLINVYHEYLGNYNCKRVLEQAEKIYDTCLDALKVADKERISTRKLPSRWRKSGFRLSAGFRRPGKAEKRTVSEQNRLPVIPKNQNIVGILLAKAGRMFIFVTVLSY